MGTMDRLFQLMAEKKASDIFVSVGSPINIKINGVAVAVNQQVMDNPTITTCWEILRKPNKEFAETLELNTGYALEGVASASR
jgi:twitching motility protein PilU